ncbi:MAG: Tol-Pal system beta propeller repeat protein TolB [Betaproteobacteria bacterium RBG_16_64_18]|nr:MAG: Tol-Pal system beta propeller repeat protein TolB [Betaproteobacteria bacterium RBG_16_64_18]OGA09910.1 MAG: Tol-Pal system beta propeller repeat protein TolB [Betaproteobacteria bacterium RIFCSPLOWO2_02_FULL_65_20]OGA42213.1 MAG: Tol-Pal system beta propeller repeat protein TolB [Betaproteobacteria bacterium RIFCSPLOWO2_12_FULL_65_110]
MIRTLLHLLAACLWLASGAARAQLTIEITGGGGNQIPVAVLQFAGEAVLPTSITDIIEADLLRSGRFRTQYAGGVNPLPTEPSQVNFGDWKTRGADAIVIGGAQRLPDGRFEVRFRLFDVPKQTQLAGVAYTLSPAQARATAHRIADVIYEKLTGERGVFSTRIAYVVKQNGRFELRIADADGQGAQVALASREPIISPSWSPDGTRLAYVSFESKKPVVYVHSLTSGQRHVVANFRGSNSAPSWSPDGKQLAAVLSKEGGSQIYLINADGSNVRRITQSAGIDTEPFFSADGQFIYFTSDRGGSPQIYRMSAAGGEASRITFDGGYNVSPRLSVNGKSMAFVSRHDGRFQLAVMDLESRQMQVLTDTQRDESPSFAPNGTMILYATEVGGRGVLAAVSADGRVKQRLSVQAADVREPAWGPFLVN